MKNLDQIRAANAINADNDIGKGVNNGEVVKKVPAYIMNNGLLATAAFASESKGGYEDVFKAVICHLKDRRVGKLPKEVEGSSASLIRYLVDKDSSVLRDITMETMAYLNYLRRFAGKK